MQPSLKKQLQLSLENPVSNANYVPVTLENLLGDDMSFKFNLGAIQESKPNTNQDKELLPEGFYAAKMIECELKVSKAGHPFFSMTYEIVEDGWANCPFIGRRCWSTLMLDHPNETVVSIAHKAIADILVACGVPADAEIEDIENDFPMVCLDKPLYIHVGHRKNKEKNTLQAEPNAYFGRLDNAGKHRYGKDYEAVPNTTTTLTANPELALAGQQARDKALAKLSAPTSQHPVLDYKQGKGSYVQNFEDVPF